MLFRMFSIYNSINDTFNERDESDEAHGGPAEEWAGKTGGRG